MTMGNKKKKKPLARQSNIDDEIAHSKKFPLQDGFKVTKTASGYEVVWQERGVKTGRTVFKTKTEAENYLKNL